MTVLAPAPAYPDTVRPASDVGAARFIGGDILRYQPAGSCCRDGHAVVTITDTGVQAHDTYWGIGAPKGHRLTEDELATAQVIANTRYGWRRVTKHESDWFAAEDVVLLPAAGAGPDAVVAFVRAVAAADPQRAVAQARLDEAEAEAEVRAATRRLEAAKTRLGAVILRATAGTP